MSERTPVRDTYDAIVDLLPYEGVTDRAYALAKFTFVWHDGDPMLRRDAPETLAHDFRDESLTPRLRPGTDFWPTKRATDIVVRGSAFAPDGHACEHMTARVAVGEMEKRVRVFGRRAIEWSASGAPRIGRAEPFERIALTYENAYGGIDYRATCDIEDARGIAFLADADHPGLYPRNPFGKGYLATPERIDGIEMPNLEDPSDLLTDERLIVTHPSAWWRQPLPWCFDWAHPVMFPRHLFTGDGIEPWFPPPDDARMPEVTRGFLPENHRAIFERATPSQLHARFRQEASLGMTVRDVRGGTPIVLEGMHPEYAHTSFEMTRFAPSFAFDLEGTRIDAQPRLHSVVIRPAVRKVNLVFGASVPLHRGFVRGLHREIPVAVSIEGDRPIHFEAPETVRDRLSAAAARG